MTFLTLGLPLFLRDFGTTYLDLSEVSLGNGFGRFLSALGSLRPARKGTFSLAMTDSISSIIRP